ncbi:MAG: Phenylalanine--tRNA ligase beta subunit [Mycoplasmataceae bacterium]|nr:MAG: Phenylalanine--tRNA ligase beta subunit [Mycoplasmataceae bacterium]
MHINWKWIKKQLNLPDNYSLDCLIEKLNYSGLECEKSFGEDQEVFLNFVVASNRKDLKSWWGISREISILLGIEKPSFLNIDIKKENNNFNDELSFEIKDDSVKSYNLCIIHDLENINSAPAWIESALKKNQIRSINKIVDIANFITLETGQPIHVFDFDKIESLKGKKKVLIRRANNGESFIDIYGKNRDLTSEDVVVSSNDKVIDLAGIIGDKFTSVTHDTKSILIESASFESCLIKNSSDRINLNTNASDIFIKEFNQESSLRALLRITDLIKELCQINKKNNEKEKFLFYNKELKNTKIIKISHNYFEKKLGAKIDRDKILDIFNRLDFSFNLNKNTYLIEIPSHRVDISIKEDLVEEIGKILDYNLLSGSIPILNNQFIDKEFNLKHNLKRKISTYLLSLGYQEIISYSLVKDDFPKEDESFFRVLIPKSSSYSVYRKSFILSHLKIIENNLRQGSDDVFLFEIGYVYSKDSEKIIENEILSLTGSGNIFNSSVHFLKQNNDFYWSKGLLENIFSILNLDKDSFSYSDKNFDSLKFDYCLEISFNNRYVGFLAKLSDKYLEENKISKFNCFTSQLSIGDLLNFACQEEDQKYLSISYLPIIKKDISFIINKDAKLEEILSLIKENGGDFLINVSLFDTYDKDFSSNEYSLSFRLMFQGKERNLQNKEIDEILNKVLISLNNKFFINVR